MNRTLATTALRWVMALILGLVAVVAQALPADASQGTRPTATTTANNAYDSHANLVLGADADARGSGADERRVADARGPSLAPSGELSAPEATRTVTIGRNMGERVIPYAERHGYDWYRGTPRWVPRNLIERVSPRTLERMDLWFNRRWIRGEMGQGSRIVDIGEPPGYPPSRFYDMELDEVSGYCNYCRDPQP